MAVTGWIGDDERVEQGSRWVLLWLAGPGTTALVLARLTIGRPGTAMRAWLMKGGS